MHQSALHFIHKVYTYFDSTSMSPQNNESNRSWSSCSSSTSPILLQLELGYLSDAAEIQDIAEALSYRALFFPSSSISPKLSPSSKTTALSAVWSTSLLSVLSLTLCSILYIAPKIPSPSLQTSDSSSSKGPLLLPEASPKRSVPI